MNASQDTVRKAIAAALSEGLPFQVSPYVLSSPTPPCAYVTIGPEDYYQNQGDTLSDLTFVVYTLVGMATDIGASERLAPMMAKTGATSVKQLIEVDRTLGGACEFLHCPSRSGERVYAEKFLGFETTVIVRG